MPRLTSPFVKRKRHYPHKRMPPIRHKVKGHVRQTKTGRTVPVREYERGSRIPEGKVIRRLTSPFVRRYDVRIQYTERRAERLIVRAPDPLTALDLGFLRRREYKVPKMVVIHARR